MLLRLHVQRFYKHGGNHAKEKGQHRNQAAGEKFMHINPHAGAATGTNSDENGAARFPFSATMGLREANYKAR